MSQQLGALQTHTTDTFLFISHTMNVLLFKFRRNIFNGVRIIKEMPGSVVSGTRCITRKTESGFSGSGKFVSVGFCQHDDEFPRSIEGAELFDKLNDHERVQNHSVLYCYINP